MSDSEVVEQAVNVAYSLAVLGASIVGTAILYFAGVRTLFRLGRSDRFAVEATARCKWPARSTAVLGAILVGLPFTRLPEGFVAPFTHVVLVLAIVLATMALLRLSVAIEVAIVDREDLLAEDNARARGRVTKVTLLRRVSTGVIIMMGIGGVLMTFESARTVGTSLLASAGILGLIAGVSAQATLGNMVAGIQLAVTDPLRLDDVVVVEGEWGNVEEVGLTYVIIRTWDRRRLVLPTSYFVNTPFQNWTRDGSQIIGSITWEVDQRAPVGAIRDEFHRQVEAHPLWDGDVAVLQVIEVGSETVTIRGLVTAPDAARVWDLRCAIREGVLTWMARTHPEALPVTRLLEAVDTPEFVESPPGSGLQRQASPGPDTPPNPDPTRTGEWPVHP